MSNTADTGAFTPQDAVAEIIIGEDRMSASLCLHAPQNGGRDITMNDVEAAIAASPLRAETDRAVIEGMVNNRHYGEPLRIAAGIRPVNGIDGAIKYRFEPTGVLKPATNERDEMNYKDLGLIKNIIAGTIIADISPETEGTDGLDVLGNVIKAVPGRGVKTLIGKGTEINAAGTAITAVVDGNLKWSKDHFTVEEVVVIAEDVGATTGNIDFIGNVQIKGNVHEGFFVKSKKNITIAGTANNATIEAEGDVDIKMGCINSNVTAKGSVKAGFCENSTIDCGGDLSSGSFVACEIFCHGTAYAITGKGVIIGGKITCLKGMVFNTIGSESFVKTRLTLGNGALLTEEKNQLEIEEAQKSAQINQLVQIVNMLNAAKKKAGALPREREDMLATAIRSRFALANDIKKISKRIADIEASFLNNLNLQIEVRKTVWPGATIRIGSARKRIENRSDRCRISLDPSGEIAVAPITGSTK